jgi:hypothetical protein
MVQNVPPFCGDSGKEFSFMLISVAVWLTVGVGISTIVRVILAKRRARSLDLGSVSHQWIIENRAGSRDDGNY